jgi:nicotinate phosphoribosyltransferase
LLDTYDVRRAIHSAVAVARQYQRQLGHTLVAVRLDSGDLLGDSRYVRHVLDEGDLSAVKILGSGDLDEFSIAELLEAGAPIDAFGVGTSLGVGAGSLHHEVEGGSLGGVYKLVLYSDTDATDHPRIKRAGEKSTWPGKKELYRQGEFEGDLIALASEAAPEHSTRLLKPVVQQGRILSGSLPPLSEIWELAQQNLRCLPERFRALAGAPAYPVRFSPALQRLREEALASEIGDGLTPPPPPGSNAAR